VRLIVLFSEVESVVRGSQKEEINSTHNISFSTHELEEYVNITRSDKKRVRSHIKMCEKRLETQKKRGRVRNKCPACLLELV
jgi:predicted DNA-binding protein YlxM (UPF0122 family)